MSHFTDDQAAFGLQLLTEVRIGYVSLNLIDTKEGPRVAGFPSFQPKAENPHTIMRYEVVKDPYYRVWLGHGELAEQLYGALSRNTVHYTPYFGLAWMICWLEGMPALQDGEYISSGGQCTAKTVVRSDDIGGIDWANDAVYQRLRMPAEMQPDRTVTRYQEYIVETSGRNINAALNKCWRFGDGSVISPL